MLVPVLVSCLAVATSFELGHGPAYHQLDVFRRQAESQVNQDTGPLLPSYNISIPIDHFTDAGSGVYNNRYFINDTYYQPWWSRLLLRPG